MHLTTPPELKSTQIKVTIEVQDSENDIVTEAFIVPAEVLAMPEARRQDFLVGLFQDFVQEHAAILGLNPGPIETPAAELLYASINTMVIRDPRRAEKRGNLRWNQPGAHSLQVAVRLHEKVYSAVVPMSQVHIQDDWADSALGFNGPESTGPDTTREHIVLKGDQLEGGGQA